MGTGDGTPDQELTWTTKFAKEQDFGLSDRLAAIRDAADYYADGPSSVPLDQPLDPTAEKLGQR